MDNRVTYITTAEGKKLPAEVRACAPGKDLVAMYREYETSRLLSETFFWKDGGWQSKSGMTIEWDSSAEINMQPPKLVRLSKSGGAA